jgi:UDP-2,4-diacetamido-2,4,6-trideoxy-beta-L-altropyranose hydrolase
MATAGAVDEWDDAVACLGLIDDDRCDWLIVDHYGLGRAWETALRRVAERILAIDDLGREHECDALLDQNYPNPAHVQYQGRIPSDCELLLGPQYALVRPEFAALRSISLAKPRSPISRLLVFMSGTDPVDETTKALEGIRLLKKPRLQVDVAIGDGNPRREGIASLCGALPNATLHVQTMRMAELMVAADCMIGAGGSSAWERCVLGLPALVTILAENQGSITEAVERAGGHRLLGWHHTVRADDYAEALVSLDVPALVRMSEAAAAICDGVGVERVCKRLSRN